jgi:hypothetical protein
MSDNKEQCTLGYGLASTVRMINRSAQNQAHSGGVARGGIVEGIVGRDRL